MYKKKKTKKLYQMMFIELIISYLKQWIKKQNNSFPYSNV